MSPQIDLPPFHLITGLLYLFDQILSMLLWTYLCLFTINVGFFYAFRLYLIFLKNNWSSKSKIADMTMFAIQISGTALVLDKIINHVQSLQNEVEVILSYHWYCTLGNCFGKNDSMRRIKLLEAIWFTFLNITVDSA